MAELGRAVGETVVQRVARSGLGTRVRLGVGGAIGAVGFVALGAQAAALLG